MVIAFGSNAVQFSPLLIFLIWPARRSRMSFRQQVSVSQYIANQQRNIGPLMFKNCDTQHSNVLIRANSQPQLHFSLLDIQAPPFQVWFFFLTLFFFTPVFIKPWSVSAPSVMLVFILSLLGLRSGPSPGPHTWQRLPGLELSPWRLFFFFWTQGKTCMHLSLHQWEKGVRSLFQRCLWHLVALQPALVV